MTIWTLVIDGEHGATVTLYPTKALATAALDEYVVEWWEAELEDEMPEDSAERIQRYFAADSIIEKGESGDITAHDVPWASDNGNGVSE